MPTPGTSSASAIASSGDTGPALEGYARALAIDPPAYRGDRVPGRAVPRARRPAAGGAAAREARRDLPSRLRRARGTEGSHRPLPRRPGRLTSGFRGTDSRSPPHPPGIPPARPCAATRRPAPREGLRGGGFVQSPPKLRNTLPAARATAPRGPDRTRGTMLSPTDSAGTGGSRQGAIAPLPPRLRWSPHEGTRRRPRAAPGVNRRAATSPGLGRCPRGCRPRIRGRPRSGSCPGSPRPRSAPLPRAAGGWWTRDG